MTTLAAFLIDAFVALVFAVAVVKLVRHVAGYLWRLW